MAGPMTNALMCRGTAIEMRYAARISQRWPSARPARSATASVNTANANVAAYTSVSVALSHAVDMLPAQSAAANPPAVLPVHRVTRRALTPPATAVHAAENRFVASAVGI